MLQQVTHNYIINFVEGLFPLASEAHFGYTSLHKYVITIILLYKPLGCFWLDVMTIYLPSASFANQLSRGRIFGQKICRWVSSMMSYGV